MIDKEKNQVFIRNENKLKDWVEEDQDKALSRLKLTIKNYLELNNVSFLFGAGSSFPLGSVSIKNIPEQIENAITSDPDSKVNESFIQILKKLTGTAEGDELPKDDKQIKFPLEKLLNILEGITFLAENNIEQNDYNHLVKIKKHLKENLFNLCDLEQLPLDLDYLKGLDESIVKQLDSNKFTFHEKFIKKILQRPLNLRRANIFTTNYDLAFEYTFDKLGIHYINGFSGFNNRVFKPEIFEQDIYFPGSTTTGKVQRVEKVLRYYKLHGSITWKSSEPKANNIYGIQEMPVELIRSTKSFENLLIYPTSNKKSQSLDMPYSELFRQFASTINQQQSVLFTIGYSFRDEHINDIIYQALSIPSFTLIIVDKYGNEKIDELIQLDDPRIIVVKGEQLGDFIYFVSNVLPDLYDIDTAENVANSMKKIYDKDATEIDDIEEEGADIISNGDEEK